MSIALPSSSRRKRLLRVLGVSGTAAELLDVLVDEEKASAADSNMSSYGRDRLAELSLARSLCSKEVHKKDLYMAIALRRTVLPTTKRILTSRKTGSNGVKRSIFPSGKHASAIETILIQCIHSPCTTVSSPINQLRCRSPVALIA